MVTDPLAGGGPASPGFGGLAGPADSASDPWAAPPPAAPGTPAADDDNAFLSELRRAMDDGTPEGEADHGDDDGGGDGGERKGSRWRRNKG